MNTKDVAAYLKIGENHARWLLSTGQVKSGKVANTWKTTQEALDNFLLSGGEVMTRTALERHKQRRKYRRTQKEATT